MSIFAATLSRLMNRKNISDKEMAEALDISQTQLYNLLSDYIVPNRELLDKICSYFDITKNYITGEIYNADIDEPPSQYARSICVPVVNASAASSSLVKDSDIVDYAFYVPPTAHGNNDYIAVKIEFDTNIGDRVLKKGDVAVINTSTQYAENDVVAYSKRNKPVDFRRYTRAGIMVTLYSFTDAEPFVFKVGDPDYQIIGVVKAVHGNI